MREMSTYFLNLILKPFNAPIILLSLVYTINTGREGGREEGRKEGRKEKGGKREQKDLALNEPNFGNHSCIRRTWTSKGFTDFINVVGDLKKSPISSF